MAGKSKKAKVVREAAHFDVAKLRALLRPPRTATGATSWDIAAIRAARADQMLGNFHRPARLAEMLRSDAALFVAWLNRLAPQRGLPVEIQPPNKTGAALKVAAEATALYGPGGIGATSDTFTSLDDSLTNHGVAFGVNELRVRDDGSRVDLFHTSWPIEHVRWDAYRCTFLTRTEAGPEEVITHGDGRWTVYRLAEIEPWKHGAVIPAGEVWGDRRYAVRDRSKAGTAHGNAKVVGTLPEGMAIDSPEGLALLEMCEIIASVDAPFGVKPFGSAIDYITNNSQAWQIFRETILANDKDAAKIYLGSDGTTIDAGGNYIKSRMLFGVRNDLVEGNLNALQRGFKQGCLDVWTALNWGDSTIAPNRVYLMPDADQDARRDSLAMSTANFFRDIASARSSGFDVTPEYAAKLAVSYGIEVPPMPAQESKAPSIALAPTDIAKVVRVNEARASAGLGPLTFPNGTADPDGMLTVSEFAAKIEAKASTPTAPAADGATPAAAPPAAPASASRASSSPLRRVP